jgi:hypothetical protein
MGGGPGWQRGWGEGGGGGEDGEGEGGTCPN